MLAVVKENPGPGFALKQVALPQIRGGEVLVQVKAVGICGTDLPIFSGVRAVPPGLIPGHEFAGEIVEIGHAVRHRHSPTESWAVGDRVAVSIVKGCGQCYPCRTGDEPRCDHLTELGIDVNGGYAEYAAVPASCLHRLPDHLSFEDGACIDPIASAYRGVRKAVVGVEDTVAILGPGPIGLYALQTIKARGANQVIVIGQREAGRRLQVAEQLGADHVFSAQAGNPAEFVAAATGGRMTSVVIEATGNAAALPVALNCAAKGARVVLLGIFHDETRVNPAVVVRRELEVIGSFCYSWADFEESLGLLARRKVTTKPVVSHVMALEQISAALELIRARQAVKIILKPRASEYQVPSDR